MKSLQVIHNNITRVILDLPRMFSATETLNRLHWKPLSLRRSNHCSIFMYKCINNLIEHDFPIGRNQDLAIAHVRRKMSADHVPNVVGVSGPVHLWRQQTGTKSINLHVKLKIY